MIDTTPDLAALLDKERKRAAKPEKTREQRARRRLLGRFHDTLAGVWLYAHLLDDAELHWLSMVTEAAKAKGTRKHRRWSGRTDQVVKATNYEDAVRLDRMRSDLWTRSWERERQQHAADRRKVAQALQQLGLPVPEHFARAAETQNTSGEDVSPQPLRPVPPP
jgi:hypothetical protein